METFGRKGLSGNCEVIYFYSRKCSSSHLELLPEKIFLAIEVRTVFQARWGGGGEGGCWRGGVGGGVGGLAGLKPPPLFCNEVIFLVD